MPLELTPLSGLIFEMDTFVSEKQFFIDAAATQLDVRPFELEENSLLYTVIVSIEKELVF